MLASTTIYMKLGLRVHACWDGRNLQLKGQLIYCPSMEENLCIVHYQLGVLSPQSLVCDILGARQHGRLQNNIYAI
jgi:hypothetical protein